VEDPLEPLGGVLAFPHRRFVGRRPREGGDKSNRRAASEDEANVEDSKEFGQ